MKNQVYLNITGLLRSSTLLFIAIFSAQVIFSTLAFSQSDTSTFKQYKGVILDSNTKKQMAFATLAVLGTNISGVSNSEGEFSLKIPKENSNSNLMVSFLGYKNKTVSIIELKSEKNQIFLEPFNIALGEIVVSTNDAEKLFKQMMERREQNYGSDLNLMTGF